MITNERQYRITKQQLNRIKEAIKNFDVDEAEDRIGSVILAKAELNALKGEEQVIADQVSEYEALRSGVIKKFEASSLHELPEILIRARIAQQLTQRELGDLIGVKEQQIQRYEASYYSGANLRRLQEISNALKLNITKIVKLQQPVAHIRASQIPVLDWSKFPIREMYRRGWFEGFTGTLDAALDQSNLIVQNYVQDVIKKPAYAYYRRRIRNGVSIDDYALFSWECRILSLAKKRAIGHVFQSEDLTNAWVKELVKQSKEYDGPLRAKEMLEEKGIALVIEPHLARTHIDGAALLYQGSPVIGMTLRYDRLDNFWFVLLHELFHVIKHLRKGRIDCIFDDLDVEAGDQIEKEADQLASEALIPANVWDKAICRFVRTNETVQMQAEDLGINPAIIAGRIRYEANNYTILSDLIGQGEVRKNFPDVRFGT